VHELARWTGEDYKVYLPILNSLGAMGKGEAKRNMAQRRIAAFENHSKQVPDNAVYGASRRVPYRK
jgi:hypothetical protein